jgi:membrane-associated phospholipid phosphatase
MKLIFGKPRPDLLSRCNPDLTRIREFTINRVGETFNQNWVLVTSGICQNPDRSRGGELMDGFKSFPSGHASFSWAGLLYLSLFLASKFAIAIPFLPPRPYSSNPAHTSATAPSNIKKQATLSFHKQDSTLFSHSTPTNFAEEYIVPMRYQNAAPPVYTLILVLVPIGAAIYIAATRFTDFRHFGFDLLFGSFIGITTSWCSFRFYHLPITRGAGWAWGPRSYQRAFGIGVGMGSYVGTEGWSKGGQVETGVAGESQTGVLMESRESDATRAEGVHAV